MDRIEAEALAREGIELLPSSGYLTGRQRASIPFREIARVAAQRYPRRALLGLALFVGQAFLYNAVSFDLGTILSGYFGVASGAVPGFMLLFATSNFLGPLLLGRLSDTVGRKPVIMATYFGSAVIAIVLGVVTMTSALSAWQFSVLVAMVFFIASAGASSAYLTVSEVFPMESRALCIALFFAVGTAVGGITGFMLFGQFVHGGSLTLAAVGFLIGAGVMALGGVAEVFFGVRAEQQSLENIAPPLTAEETESDWEQPGPAVARDERAAHRREHERAGARRYRPGPGGPPYSPGMAGTGGPTSRTAVMADRSHNEEIDEVAAALERYGPLGRQAFEQAVRGRAWAPGRFRTALKDTVEESRAQRLSSGAYTPPARAGR